MGQKQAAYDATGAIVAYYDSVDSPAPAGAQVINITEAQWQTCISTHGYTVASGALVAPVAPTAAQLLASAQATQVAMLSAACADSIVAGFTSTALGVVHTYPAKTTDQQNLSASIIAALLALNAAVPWTAGKARAAGDLVKDGAALYVCVAAGTSGATAPTWPTTDGAIASDGGAQWQMWVTPFWCEDASGNWAFVNHSAAQIQQVGVDGKSSILANMAKNQALYAQVMAATTVAAVQAITWS
jgi:hypothetical protein